MSTQQYAASQGTVDRDGVMTRVLANGDIVQEAAAGQNVFRGLALAGGEAFVESDSEESEEEYHHHHHQGAYIPQQMGYPRQASSSPPQYTGQMVMPVQVVKKEKKSKKSKKERSGSSSSASGQQHTCNCGHNHH